MPRSSTSRFRIHSGSEASGVLRALAMVLVAMVAVAPPARAQVNWALASEFDAYVHFGDAAPLRLDQFTFETWMRRDGEGFGTDTGAGGIDDAMPMISKGRSEGDSPNVDINYFFGIRRSDDVLCVDFEEGPGGVSPGANHPLFGVTHLQIGVWHHVAATYDGATLRLYLDGMLESSLAVGQPPASTCAAPAALMAALNTGGVPDGAFIGILDEFRVWNVARSQAQLRATANARLATAQPGLVARWAFDEGSGTTVSGSAGTTVNGVVHGVYYRWIDGAPFNLSFDRPALLPALNGPADRALGVSLSPTLSVAVSDPESGPVTVTWHGRVLQPSNQADFTLIGLPDTQYYASEEYGGSNAMFRAQTEWIVANRASRNIAYTVQLGDCVERGDNAGNPIEWMRADSSLSVLEDPSTTGLPYGVPFGVCVGNHDQSPIGDPDGSTTFYNQFFGAARFAGRAYYGGHYGTDNDNHFQLFSAGGMNFIVICPEWDTSPNPEVIAWMDQLLTTYSNRRAIIAAHYLVNTGNPSSFSGQGQAIWDALKGHSNLFLMLDAHIDGEGRRQDVFAGNTVHTLHADYQWHGNGGDGWLRILEFSPYNNAIRVRTYSPWLGQYKVSPDSSSQFTLGYDMTSGAPFQTLGTTSNVPSGTNATFPWTGRAVGTTYEWYATLDDGHSVTRGPFWRFTTAGPVGVGDEGGGEFGLSRVAPHPVRSAARIGFALPFASPVRLAVHDLQGREVAVLADGVHAPGRHSVQWNGTGPGGRLGSGIYFLRLETPQRTFVEPLVLLD